jgi:flagellar protein FliJ
MMKRFKFRLQTLLQHKEHLEQQAQIALAKAQADLQKSETYLQTLTQDLQKSYSSEEPVLHILQGGEARMLRVRYTILLRNKIIDAQSKVQKQKDIVTKRKAYLLEKTMEKKALILLRDKQYLQWKKEANRLEVKAADDYSSMRFLHNSLQSASGEE